MTGFRVSISVSRFDLFTSKWIYCLKKFLDVEFGLSLNFFFFY